MALATVNSTSYGLRVTGGTDATPATTFKTRVGMFHFVAAGAADTCIITDGDGNAVITLTSLGAAGDITSADWYEAPLDGITVTLSDASGVLIVLLR